jgi:hypothetical protein
MTRMNWEAHNRRRRIGSSIQDERERMERDPAAQWLARFALGGFPKNPPSNRPHRAGMEVQGAIGPRLESVERKD